MDSAVFALLDSAKDGQPRSLDASFYEHATTLRETLELSKRSNSSHELSVERLQKVISDKEALAADYAAKIRNWRTRVRTAIDSLQPHIQGVNSSR